jgi:hypothetical protein
MLDSIEKNGFLPLQDQSVANFKMISPLKKSHHRQLDIERTAMRNSIPLDFQRQDQHPRAHCAVLAGP